VLPQLRGRVLPACLAVTLSLLWGAIWPSQAKGRGAPAVSKKLAETLWLVVAICFGVKVAAGFVSAAVPAVFPVFVMGLAALLILRWRSRL
jgi:hypothetical protein